MKRAQKNIRLAVVGAGPFARKYHYPAIEYLRRKRGHGFTIAVKGIWNRERPDAETLAARYRIPGIYGSLDELIDDPDINGIVVLVNPKATHEVITHIASRRDIPVFTEKPPGISFVLATELAAAVKAPNVVAFNRRYDTLYNEYKRIVDSMNGVSFVECQFFRYNRNESGFVLTTGVHAVNYLEYLFGPIAQAQTERWENGGSFSWTAQLRFTSGLRGSIAFFPCSGSVIERFAVHSADTSAYLNGGQYHTMDRPGSIVIHRAGKADRVITGKSEPTNIIHAGFIAEYLEFFSAIADGASTRSNFINAANAMRVVEHIEAGLSL
ncbi:MAG: Gfo/Idh/MocA family oxidoreductase [Spirochaetes bacterium]|nr:Gfo/Idh/MocA family oxidoreductase [Spirochaetota bacterium]